MDNFNFNRDFFEGCAALGDKDGAALAWALIRYGYTGEEPQGLKPALSAAFNFARGRVDAMRQGAKGGAKRNRTKPQRKADTPSLDPSLPPSDTPSLDPSLQKEKEKEKEKEEIASAISCAPEFSEAYPYAYEPPEVGEVRAYFAANCLHGSSDEFFDHFAAQGWVRSNGQPVADWKAQARQWSRRQVEFDQSKPADLRAPDKPMPKAENAVDWEAELARLEADGWSA